MRPRRAGGVSLPRLVLGLSVIAVGMILCLDRLGLLAGVEVLRYWPLALVAIGIAKVIEGRSDSAVLAGVVWVVAGGWLLAYQLGWVHVGFWDLWPLLLVALGLRMILASVRGGGLSGRSRGASPDGSVGEPASARAPDSDAMVSCFALLSGLKRSSQSDRFRGGDLTAVMGGCEIDLTGAGIADGEAVVDVFALWGGVVIRVPREWAVSGRVMPLLGGFEDKTAPPVSGAAPRLVVKGLAIMGGVEVKN